MLVRLVVTVRVVAPYPSLCAQAVHVGNKATRGHPEYALDQAPQPWIDQYRHVCALHATLLHSNQPPLMARPLRDTIEQQKLF